MTYPTREEREQRLTEGIYPRLHKIAYCKTSPDNAEDLAQDAYLLLWNLLDDQTLWELDEKGNPLFNDNYMASRGLKLASRDWSHDLDLKRMVSATDCAYDNGDNDYEDDAIFGSVDYSVSPGEVMEAIAGSDTPLDVLLEHLNPAIEEAVWRLNDNAVTLFYGIADVVSQTAVADVDTHGFHEEDFFIKGNKRIHQQRLGELHGLGRSSSNLAMNQLRVTLRPYAYLKKDSKQTVTVDVVETAVMMAEEPATVETVETAVMDASASEQTVMIDVAETAVMMAEEPATVETVETAVKDGLLYWRECSTRKQSDQPLCLEALSCLIRLQAQTVFMPSTSRIETAVPPPMPETPSIILDKLTCLFFATGPPDP